MILKGRIKRSEQLDYFPNRATPRLVGCATKRNNKNSSLPQSLRIFPPRPVINSEECSSFLPLGPRSIPVGSVMRVAESTNVLAAAGAIKSMLIEHSKVLVLAKGAGAVYTAVKAIATARIKVQESHSFDIVMQPVLQPRPKNPQDRHAIRMYLYRAVLSLDSKLNPHHKILRVGYNTDANALGGSISNVMGSGVTKCVAASVGSMSTYTAVRGIAIARYVMLRPNLLGEDLTCSMKGTSSRSPMDLIATPHWQSFTAINGSEGRMLMISLKTSLPGEIEDIQASTILISNVLGRDENNMLELRDISTSSAAHEQDKQNSFLSSFTPNELLSCEADIYVAPRKSPKL